jgi:hypothetical protein
MAVQHPRSPAAGANARDRPGRRAVRFHHDRDETCGAIAFYGGVGEYDEAGYVDA